MKKGRVSLTISIVLLIIGIAAVALGSLNGVGLLDFRLIPFFDSAAIYVGLLPNSYGVLHFGVLLIAISIIILSFRQRKPYSMFLPVFMVGIYVTIGVFLRLCYSQYVPEELFVTLKNERIALPLMFLLIAIEIALTIVLLIATEKLDARWRKKVEITRKKLESEGVLVSKEDVAAQRARARIDRDSSLAVKKLEKEEKKLEKDRLRAEKIENRKRDKERRKEERKYEKTREALERKKEDIEDREALKAQKEADKKAYLESVENDKQSALRNREKKKLLKEQKRLEKEKKRVGEPIEENFEIPSGPANPNTPLDFPTLPDFGELSEFSKMENPARLDISAEDDIEAPPVKPMIEERAKYDLNTKHYKAGGMLEATLEMMNATQNSASCSQDEGRIIEEDDVDDEVEIPSRNIPVSSNDNIAPSNLPPTHPRYKMFESLQSSPVAPAVNTFNPQKEEREKIAPSNLPPTHPRYKMFESLKNTSSNIVSHFPTRAFEPEEESVPTTGVKSVDYSSIAPEPVAETPKHIYQEDKKEDYHAEVIKEIYREPAKENPVATNRHEEPVVEKDVYSTVDIPPQTESVDFTAGIGGLVSNNGGYNSIMQRGRRNYTPPPVSLMKDYPGISNEIDELTRALGEAIVETYAQQRTMVQLTHIIKGPTVTMYELTLEPGTLISRITSRENELSYALGGKHVRILAPVPGKQAVGIEVPNSKTSIVGFKDMIYSLRANEKYLSLRVPMILGKTITGEPIVIDVAKMPHMIIAGTTGSGKSVCINAFINTLIYQKAPSEVRLILIDPKVVELTLYNGIPHLLTPVITDAKKVVKVLNFLVEEMERRYSMLANLGVRNIEGYNQKLRDEHIAAEKMPYIVLIMDEFADMMSVVGKDIEIQIARLAAKARAAGIHLILATQRPSSDVITGTIKSNLPARIAFAVSSGTNSRVILDEGGAENLLGKGDMLLMDPSSMGLQRIQGAYLSDSEVEAIVSFAKEHGGEPDYLDDVIFEDHDDRSSSDDGFGDGPIGDEDSDEQLFEQAKAIVYEKKSASASYLQRRMKIGYNRAARLIEMMEEKGIVGPANGSKPREILKFE